MPTYDTGPSPRYLAALQKWKKHFNALGCSQSKAFVLARKYALKETRSLNSK